MSGTKHRKWVVVGLCVGIFMAKEVAGFPDTPPPSPRLPRSTNSSSVVPPAPPAAEVTTLVNPSNTSQSRNSRNRQGVRFSRAELDAEGIPSDATSTTTSSSSASAQPVGGNSQYGNLPRRPVTQNYDAIRGRDTDGNPTFLFSDLSDFDPDAPASEEDARLAQKEDESRSTSSSQVDPYGVLPPKPKDKNEAQPNEGNSQYGDLPSRRLTQNYDAVARDANGNVISRPLDLGDFNPEQSYADEAAQRGQQRAQGSSTTTTTTSSQMDTYGVLPPKPKAKASPAIAGLGIDTKKPEFRPGTAPDPGERTVRRDRVAKGPPTELPDPPPDDRDEKKKKEPDSEQ